MRGRDKYCITVSGTTNQEMWQEIRDVLGPTPALLPELLDLMNDDIAEYNDWIAEYGTVPFDKWLIWKLRVGTDRYGNLPEDKKLDGKDGHCWQPCPYSTQCSDNRTRMLLKLSDSDPLPTKVDHTNGGTTYFMRTSARGSRWGYECNYVGCTHFILNGQKYFYV